ncbi:MULTISPECIES: DUF2752 domain-containing protein [Actinomadura]|uniref:DUF2752 domain-containing protein n=1 Tax=Actinomadura TaxID=1988 RepID=UPI0003AD5798|nr:DUF2752 domain-containing protein [Actinomadura madurae]SPT58216.1 Protein of uncharacterised function (DUF2752) [Actinomadura madurae]
MTAEQRPALRTPGGPIPEQSGGTRDRTPVAAAVRLLQPGGVLFLTVAAVSLVAVVDPNEEGHYPTCPFLSLTGFQCPGCGSMRTVHALAHGRVQEAFALNVLTVVMLPLLAFFWLRWARARTLDRPARTKAGHPALIWLLFGVIVVFWVVRNLPFGAFLAA